MIFTTYEEERNYRFYEDWMRWWFSKYHRQVQNAKYEENIEELKAIKINILKNNSLEEYQDIIFERLGISYLEIKPKEILKEEMFKRNERLIFLTLKKMGYLSRQDDLYDVGLIGLTEGINSFDSSKGFKESTYLCACIRNKIRQHIYLQNMPKRKCPTSIISLDYEFDNESQNGSSYENIIPDLNVDIEKEIMNLETREILESAIQKLKLSYQEVIKKYYGLGFKPRKDPEIAQELGISQSAVNEKRKRALKHLKKILEKDFKMEGF